MIVGTGQRAREFIRAIKLHSNWGLRVIGLIDDERNLYGKEVDGYRVIGRIQDIPFLINHLVIDRVIFVVPRLWLHRIEEAILACEEVGISTSISLDLYNLRIAQTQQTDFNGFPLLEFEAFRAKEWQLFFKRLIDIFVSALFLLFFSPLILLVAIGIKLTSRGPVLFKQTRAGLNGRKFTLLKFRSMVVNAEEQKAQLLDSNEMDGPVFKIKRDPRITSIGALLRKTSIDELPQFFNVLKGDMSIVGPRPRFRKKWNTIRSGSAPSESQARYYLYLASQRSQQDRFRPMDAHGYGIHRQLVVDAGSANSLQNIFCCSDRVRRRVNAAICRIAGCRLRSGFLVISTKRTGLERSDSSAPNNDGSGSHNVSGF